LSKHGASWDDPTLPDFRNAPNGCLVAYAYVVACVLGAVLFPFVYLWATDPGPTGDDSGSPIGNAVVFIILFIILPMIGAVLGMAIAGVLHVVLSLTRRAKRLASQA
jgi:hypothetical protein